VFQATLFDYNGVLVDDEAVHLAAFQDALAPEGVTLTEHDYWQRYLGFDDAGAFRAILTDAGSPPDDALVAELIERKRPLYLARAKVSLVTFAGAREGLELCASFGPVCIVSGALRDEIELGLSVLGARHTVQAIVSAEDTQACKPDPEGYELGKKELERFANGDAAALLRRTLVIEDSTAGIQAAKAAGLFCLAVTHSYPRELLMQAGADHVIDNLTELSRELLVELSRKVHG
jgi:beta-phosphoglucomutase-like phosphatase (HAD superfamily)